MSVPNKSRAIFFICATAMLAPFASQAQEESAAAQGKKIAMERTKGNCLVCHHVPGADFYGDVAPPLVAMKQRFPDREKLRAQIHDATKFNPNSVMPPFGRHNILTPGEIDKVIEWLYTL